MPEQLSEQILSHQQAVREFVASLCAKTDPEKPDDPGRHEQIVSASKKYGLYYLNQAKKFGGEEASMLTLTAVRETLASLNPPFSSGVFAPEPGVLAGCEAHLETHYLKPYLEGSLRSAFAFTEAAEASRATYAQIEGEFYIVNGRKSYVTGGAKADFINTLVELEKGEKCLLVIDSDLAGVSVDTVFQSLDGSHHAEISFTDVQVPMQNLIGNSGAGLKRALSQINDTRIAFAAESVGLMLWITQFVEQHLQAPHISGEPLAAREGVRLRYAELRIQTYAARSMLYRTARLIDSGEKSINEVAATKIYSTETLAQVLDAAIQLVGGKALVESHPLAKLYKRVRALRIAEGASDVLRLSVARGALDMGLGRL